MGGLEPRIGDADFDAFACVAAGPSTCDIEVIASNGQVAGKSVLPSVLQMPLVGQQGV